MAWYESHLHAMTYDVTTCETKWCHVIAFISVFLTATCLAGLASDTFHQLLLLGMQNAGGTDSKNLQLYHVEGFIAFLEIFFGNSAPPGLFLFPISFTQSQVIQTTSVFWVQRISMEFWGKPSLKAQSFAVSKPRTSSTDAPGILWVSAVRIV